MPRNNALSPHKRTEVVLALLRKEDTIANLARRNGVSEESLYRWRDDFVAAAKQQLASKGASAESRRELEQLKSIGGGDVVTPHEVYTGQTEIELPKCQGWAKAARRKPQQTMDAEQVSIEAGSRHERTLPRPDCVWTGGGCRRFASSVWTTPGQPR